MKLLNTIAICLFFSLIIISCGEDETVLSDLEGDWTATSFTLDVTSSSTFAGNELVTTSNGQAQNLNYDLTLDNGNFTTSGSYGIEITINVLGNPTTTNQDYTDVNGSGTYSNTETEITVDGQFFALELDGVPMELTTGGATANYTISGDVLTITQDEETTTDNLGVIATNRIVSISKWNRK